MSSASLPLPLGPLIGRDAEIRRLNGLLRESRLVTLTGPGGSGKSRLAIEGATRFSPESPDPAEAAAWIELAPLADPTLLEAHVASSLCLVAGPGRAHLPTLVAALQGRDLLLVLDNCEHLVEACAALAERLLRGCPRLRILATSREALGLPGERVWKVPPLSLPPAGSGGGTGLDAVAASESAQLFAARARESNPAFRITPENAGAVAAICRRLDGLPLALELAAARIRVLPVEQLERRLDDAFRLLTSGGRTSLPRQKTLRGAFDWSFDLLSREQQVLLHRLSVFAGSFTLEAVEEVCAGGLVDSWDALDALTALADRSLVALEVEADRARYRLLETVRQYGRERLEGAGETEEIRSRHAAFYLAFAERLAPELFAGAVDYSPMLALEREHDNLRAAGDWARESDDRAETALRLGVALHWFWYFRGHFQEGMRRLEEALAVPLSRRRELPPAADRHWRGQALAALAFFAVSRGAEEQGLEAAREAVGLLRGASEAGGSVEPLVYALAIQAAVTVSGDPHASARIAEEATILADARPTTVLTAFVAHWRGVAAHALGSRERARASFQRTIEIGRDLGHAAAVAHASYFLGRLEWEAGNGPEARRVLAESLTLHAATGNRWGIAQCLEQLGTIVLAEHDPERGLRILGAAERLRGELGSVASPADRAELETRTRDARDAAGMEASDLAWREGRELPFASLLTLALGEREAPAPPSPLARPRGGSAALRAPRLRVEALGPFAVRREGGPSGEGGQREDSRENWSSTRTRELLVFFLLHPEGASKEEVGLALWPDATPAQIRNSFHVTLHRLRGALGAPQSVRLETGRYSLDPALFADFDAARFEREARAALDALRSARSLPGGPDESAARGALAALAGALEVCRGDLLEGEPAGEWCRVPRERLRALRAEAEAALRPATTAR